MMSRITAPDQCGSIGTLYVLENSRTPSSVPHSTHLMNVLHPLLQNGSTAILLAALKGHKDLVEELCETFGADFLHRNKVRAMQTVSGSEWLGESCVFGFNVGCDLCPFGIACCPLVHCMLMKTLHMHDSIKCVLAFTQPVPD